MPKALFITRNDIVTKTALGGNVDSDKFEQFVLIAQDIHLENILGTRLYTKISDDILADSLTGDYSTLVVTYIKPVLIHYAMVEYLPWASFTIGNKGVFKGTTEQGDNAQQFEIKRLEQKERDIAESYAEKLRDHLCAFPTRYPEYYEWVNGDTYPDKSNANRGGWFIG